MNLEKTNILVVDDEQHQLDTVCRGLFLYGFNCVGVLGVKQALDFLENDKGNSIDLILTDLTMPEQSGLSLIREVHKKRRDFPIIVVTGLAATSEVDAVRHMGIPILQKPFKPDSLDAAIRQELAKTK